MTSVATVLQLFSRYAVIVCLIDREAASLALNATGQDGINMKTLYQASREQRWTPAALGPWHLLVINAQSGAGWSVLAATDGLM